MQLCTDLEQHLAQHALVSTWDPSSTESLLLPGATANAGGGVDTTFQRYLVLRARSAADDYRRARNKRQAVPYVLCTEVVKSQKFVKIHKCLTRTHSHAPPPPHTHTYTTHTHTGTHARTHPPTYTHTHTRTHAHTHTQTIKHKV